MKKIIVLVLTLFLLTANIALAALNINTASQKELTSLAGVGEKKAEAIVDYRKQHGDFKKMEDLMNVKGIGPQVYKKLLKEITL